MRRCPWLMTLVAAGLISSGSTVLAQTSLGVGTYAPELPLNPYEWFSYAQALAKHLSTALGVPVQGFAYKSAGDFQRDLKARRIQFAVLGGFNMASGHTGRVLASAKLASRRTRQWSLLCKRRTYLAALRGKVLQLPSLGPLVNGLVQNGLLGGNINITRHFKIARSPSLTSAAEAVRLGQADAVFGPVDTKGLVAILRRSITVPPPAFVLVDPGMSAEQAKKATAAILSFGGKAGEAVVGWGGGNAAQYGKLAALSKRRPLRMVMTPTAALRLKHGDIIDARVVKLELPDLDPLFAIP